MDSLLGPGTILSDDELNGTSSESEGEDDAAATAPRFSYEELDETFEYEHAEKQNSWDFSKVIADMKLKQHPAQRKTTSLDEKIRITLEKRARNRGGVDSGLSDITQGEGGVNGEIDDNEEAGSGEEADGNVHGCDVEVGAAALTLPAVIDQSEEKDEETVIQSVRSKKKDPKTASSASAVADEAKAFSQLNLSRPLMRAVQALGFERPTPIQARAIPLVLAGRDVCGRAVTGSGKTAAYLLPVLERLLFRPRRVAATRVLAMVPTRELAQQVLSMLEKLAQFTDVRAIAIVGGLSVAVQAVELRTRPDVVVATPGRLIDHLRNTQSVDLDDCEILILDEADRLLELGFHDEISELVKFCPKKRQTLLFSATISASVTRLAKTALHHNAVTVSADPLFDMAHRLVQEFVRIRPPASTNELKLRSAKKLIDVEGGDQCEGTRTGKLETSEPHMFREAVLLALCTRNKEFSSRTIVFFLHKHRVHRASIVFGLLGLRAAELHGNLTQAQRLESLQRFRDGAVDFLLCTDLASRGLDIQGVQCVINVEMPRDLASYVHRVGRTARAGRGGRCITLTGERNRHIMREVLKRSRQNVKSRKVPVAVIEEWSSKIAAIEDEVRDVIQQERLEKEMRVAEMHANKAANVMHYQDEILARPARTWFQSQRRKESVREQSRAQALGIMDDGDGDASSVTTDKQEANEKERRPHNMTRAKRRRMQLREALDKRADKAVRERQDTGSEGRGSVPKQHRKRSELDFGELDVLQQRSAKSAKRALRKKEVSAGTSIIYKSKARRDNDNDLEGRGDRTKRAALASGHSIFANEGSTVAALIDNRVAKKALKKKTVAGNVFKVDKNLATGGLRHGGKKTGFKSKSRFKRRR